MPNHGSLSANDFGALDLFLAAGRQQADAIPRRRSIVEARAASVQMPLSTVKSIQDIMRQDRARLVEGLLSGAIRKSYTRSELFRF
jgi:hypothetical protein